MCCVQLGDTLCVIILCDNDKMHFSRCWHRHSSEVYNKCVLCRAGHKQPLCDNFKCLHGGSGPYSAVCDFAILYIVSTELLIKLIKIPGITFTNSLLVSLHVQSVITSYAQTLYALRVLRAHGLCESALQTVLRAVVIAKLMYWSSAWWDFPSVTDHQKLKAFIQRSIHAGFYTPEPNRDF